MGALLHHYATTSTRRPISQGGSKTKLTLGFPAPMPQARMLEFMHDRGCAHPLTRAGAHYSSLSELPVFCRHVSRGTCRPSIHCRRWCCMACRGPTGPPVQSRGQPTAIGDRSLSVVGEPRAALGWARGKALQEE